MLLWWFASHCHCVPVPLLLKPTGSDSASWRHATDDTAVSRVILQRGKVRRVVDGEVGKRETNPAKVAAMDPAEVEFLAEKETVKIIPNFSLDKVYLIGVRRLSAPWSDQLQWLQKWKTSTSVAELRLFLCVWMSSDTSKVTDSVLCRCVVVLCCVVLRATWVLSTPDFRLTSPCGWRSTWNRGRSAELSPQNGWMLVRQQQQLAVSI